MPQSIKHTTVTQPTEAFSVHAVSFIGNFNITGLLFLVRNERCQSSTAFYLKNNNSENFAHLELLVAIVQRCHLVVAVPAHQLAEGADELLVSDAVNGRSQHTEPVREAPYVC